MELLKPKDNLTYSIGDVKFFIRTQMTVRDKFDLDMTGEFKDGSFSVKKGEILAKLVELFVMNWEGVTEDGKAVPYSFQTMCSRLPADQANDWILKLGAYIMEQTGLLPKESDGATTKNA